MTTLQSASSRRAARIAASAYSYMLPKAEQFYETENYVACPPALYITDPQNNVWTVGMQFQRMSDGPRGEFSFNVLRNSVDTGEFASRIERRGNRIRIFTRNGWKYWNGQSFL